MTSSRPRPGPGTSPTRRWLASAAVALALALVGWGIAQLTTRTHSNVLSARTTPAPASAAGGLSNSAAPPPPASTLEVAQAVMVTADLDFGGGVPTVAAALTDIERRHQPDGGTGRTRDLPVIFPDDPSAVNLIARLMRW